MKPKQPKKQPKQYVDQNPVEIIKGFGGAFSKSLRNDFLEGSVHDAWDQMVSSPKARESQTGGELSAGEELSLEKLEKQVVQITDQGREYVKEVIRASEKSTKNSSQEIEVRMQEILIEIKQLTKSSKQLEKTVQVEAIEQGMHDPGVYHVGFLEKILSTLRDARASVEDSLAWFNALRSKKASRQYGVLAKKQGTSFTLSSERVVSTQTG